MRARIRHFNARDAGAVLVLDSRFLSGLSNNSLVELWKDRTNNANDAVKYTPATTPPTYKTNVQGGQPGVQFNSVNALINTTQSLLSAGTAHSVIISGICLTFGIMFCIRRTTKYRYYGFSRVSNVNYIQSDGVDTGSNVTVSNFDFRTSPFVTTFKMQGLNNPIKFYANGIEIPTLTGVQKTETGSAGYFIGMNPPGNYYNGNLYSILVIPTSLTNAQLKRMHHTSAFSFKIPCS